MKHLVTLAPLLIGAYGWLHNLPGYELWLAAAAAVFLTNWGAS